jgi:hypothetical protein
LLALLPLVPRRLLLCLLLLLPWSLCTTTWQQLLLLLLLLWWWVAGRPLRLPAEGRNQLLLLNVILSLLLTMPAGIFGLNPGWLQWCSLLLLLLLLPWHWQLRRSSTGLKLLASWLWQWLLLPCRVLRLLLLHATVGASVCRT